MAHWENRPESRWKDFSFNQPYAKGLAKLREVLATTDFDPATLWQWGTMQAMALIEILKDCEAEFGEKGQKLVFRALEKVGKDVGRQILAGTSVPEGMSEAEFVSFYATVLNRIAYASLEAPRVDSKDQATFDILWCPHQDHYGPYDCRVQRYFVQGMIEAGKEFAAWKGFEVRFDTTIPSGSPTCHFTMGKPTELEKGAWMKKTKELEQSSLERAKSERSERGG